MINRRTFIAGLGYASGLFALPGAVSAIAGAAKMRTRPIPVSGEALPVVGLGTWQSFDVGDDSEVVEAAGFAENDPTAFWGIRVRIRQRHKIWPKGRRAIHSYAMFGFRQYRR